MRSAHDAGHNGRMALLIDDGSPDPLSSIERSEGHKGMRSALAVFRDSKLSTCEERRDITPLVVPSSRSRMHPHLLHRSLISREKV
ncbi:hypothetical protein OE88DRAFT_1660113 [Heliocybe sulcata]|uniref:Uncharacterized protein n=1 Tax=Heliocybe sulcata TaxID=5364 RepID=A0A5C3N1N7_9AGAM|nr:hypothetical protein OE88DRAFT_1660113 [Heliocybe sulcata]